MDIPAMEQEIKKLLEQANPDVSATDSHSDLFAVECRVMPRDMLFACMELKKKYPIDYNQHNLAAAICRQLG